MDPGAITMQPSASAMHNQAVAIATPSNLNMCPPGMEYLLGTSMIFVKQMIELLEIFTGYDTNNKYEILDMAGRRMYFAAEMSDCLTRCCFGSRRPFEIVILNNGGACCLKVKRLMTCCYCFWNGACCGKTQVFTGTDMLVGEIDQDLCDCCSPSFTVKDEQGNPQLKIKGPCSCCMCCEVHFKVTDMSGTEIGEIHKKWAGMAQEAFTTADTFGVSFPMDLDPRLKCLLIGATFMIDFMFFEHNNDNKNDRGNTIQFG